MNRSLALLVAILSSAPGCARTETTPADAPTPVQTSASAKALAAADAPKCHDDIDALEQLEGKTEAQVIEMYGEPRARRDFAMADCCHEFEIELYNTYPPGKGHDAVAIHELTWHDGPNRLTVWAHQVKSEWLILDTLCYAEGDQF